MLKQNPQSNKYEETTESVDQIWRPIIASLLKTGILRIINDNIIPTIPPSIAKHTPFNDIITEMIKTK